MVESEENYRKLMRRAYKLIHGTWGYSNLEYEETMVKIDYTPQHHVIKNAPNINGNNLMQIFVASFNTDSNYVARGYICFKEESDALQFRLMVGATAIRVHMWPNKRLFTIHELVEDEP